MTVSTGPAYINGRKVNVLRVGGGAGNYFISYAYKDKKLAK